MAWLKTYSSGTEVGRINSDQILAFDIAQDNSPDPGHGFGDSVREERGASTLAPEGSCQLPHLLPILGPRRNVSVDQSINDGAVVLAVVSRSDCVQHPPPVLTCWDAGIIDGTVPPVGVPERVDSRLDLSRHRLEPSLILRLAEHIPIVQNKGLKNHGVDRVSRYTLLVNN